MPELFTGFLLIGMMGFGGIAASAWLKASIGLVIDPAWRQFPERNRDAG